MLPSLLTIEDRLSVLRHEMDRENVDCVIVTSLNPSLASTDDEYWDAVKYISGVEASGDAVALVYKDKAFVFSDSRYKDGIEASLDKKFYSFVLSDDKGSATDAAFSYMVENIGEGQFTFSSDTRTLPYSSFRKFFRPSSIEIKGVDLVDRIWMDRPKQKSIVYEDIEGVVFDNDKTNVFSPREEKLHRITSYIENHSARIDAFLTVDETEIGYMLNLSARNGNYALASYGALIIVQEQAYLFTDAVIDKKTLEEFEKVSINASTDVKKIHVFEYKTLQKTLASLLPNGSKIGVSQGKVPMSIVAIFGQSKFVGFDLFDNIPSLFASVKSPSEERGMRLSHIQDAVAFVRFLYKLKQKEKELNNSFTYVPLKEEDYVEMFLEEKKKSPSYIKESFSPIAAFGKNGQCPHYSLKKGESAPLTSGLVVFDTGSQYEFGTTDFTRTLLVGNTVKTEWMRDYTLVLKAHLSVISGMYKIGSTTGAMLDMVARRVLWNNLDDYAHGTGHGIDCRGNVHGSYPRLSPRHSPESALYLRHGMMFSVEPGLYTHGDYGIRIENIVMVDESIEELRNKGFFVLNSLTLAPYEKRLIDKSLLPSRLVEYINGYHELIYKLLEPYLNDSEKAFLKDLTSPL